MDVIVIHADLSNERAGYYRAFWAESPDASIMSPVIGHCSPGGSHRTIKRAAWEVHRMYPDAEVYRSGRRIKFQEGMRVVRINA